MTGHSPIAGSIVVSNTQKIKDALTDPKQMQFVHLIDQTIFSHGGVSSFFVEDYLEHVGYSEYSNYQKVVELLNNADEGRMWSDDSPIWYRPPYYKGRMYMENSLFQVVGHTPVEKVSRDERGIISTDVFSNYKNGIPIGNREFVIVDTVTGEFETFQTTGLG